MTRIRAQHARCVTDNHTIHDVGEKPKPQGLPSAMVRRMAVQEQFPSPAWKASTRCLRSSADHPCVDRDDAEVIDPADVGAPASHADSDVHADHDLAEPPADHRGLDRRHGGPGRVDPGGVPAITPPRPANASPGAAARCPEPAKRSPDPDQRLPEPDQHSRGAGVKADPQIGDALIQTRDSLIGSGLC